MLERPKVSSVILNWLGEILQFDFKMEHVPGMLNLLPDKISRMYDFDAKQLIWPEQILEHSRLASLTSGSPQCFTEAVWNRKRRLRKTLEEKRFFNQK